MRERGRASIIIVAGLVSAIAVVILFFASRESPTSVAAQFMQALVKADAAKLAELSYMPPDKPEVIRQKWEATLKDAQYYKFYWEILGREDVTDTKSNILMDVIRNIALKESYPEPFRLELVKVDGKWLVEVRKISRAMYPFLPR